MSALRLQLDLFWKGSRVATKGFAGYVSGGPGEGFDFPLYGLVARTSGMTLATRTDDGFRLQVPPGTRVTGPTNLFEGDRTTIEANDFRLEATVSKVPQVVTLDFLYLLVLPLIGLQAAQWVWLGAKLVVALLLMLLTSREPALLTPMPEPVAMVKLARPVTAKFTPPAAPTPVPMDVHGRLALLREGRSMSELAAHPMPKPKTVAPGKPQAVAQVLAVLEAAPRDRAGKGARSGRRDQVADFGMIGLLMGSESTQSAVLGSLSGSNLSALTGGIGKGGFGEGTIGLGTMHTGDDDDRARLRAEATQLLRGARDCWKDGEGGVVRLQLTLTAGGSLIVKLRSSTSVEAGNCLSQQLLEHHFDKPTHEVSLAVTARSD